MDASSVKPLHGAYVVITRPVGQGRSLVRQVRALGGTAVSLPGLALRADTDADGVRRALREALQGDLVIFTSPPAVRFAAALTPLKGRAAIATVGRGTARALHRHGCRDVIVPDVAQNSEGLLAHPALASLDARRVAVVGAPGGRGLLQQALRERGAQLAEVHVYHRVPARLDRRHVRALRALSTRAYVLLSSAQTLHNLHDALDTGSWRRLQAAQAVVSSGRLADLVRQLGFVRVDTAESALASDLLARVVELDAHMK